MTYRDGTSEPALRHTETRLREHLERAQADRGRRQRPVGGFDSLYRPVTEPEWRVQERLLMHRLVNTLRAERDLAPVPLHEIRLVEDALAGRVDYTQRLVEVLARSAHGLPDDLLLPPDPGAPEGEGDGAWGDTYLSLGATTRVVVVMLVLAMILLGLLHLGRALLAA